MPDLDQENDEAIAKNPVEDPVIADTHPKDAFRAFEGFDPTWARIQLQSIDFRSKAAPDLGGQGAEILLRAVCELDRVRFAGHL